MHDLSIKTSMQFIQGDNRHETYFSTLIGQECNDYAVNFKDVFQFFLLLTRINYQVVISFNDAVKIYLPEVDTCIGTCRRRRCNHYYLNTCSGGNPLLLIVTSHALFSGHKKSRRSASLQILQLNLTTSKPAG